MKKYLTALCLLVVAAGASFGVEGKAEIMPTGSAIGAEDASELADTVLITSDVYAIIPWSAIFDKPVSAASGYLFLALSPSEHVEFQDGKLIRYICIEDENRARAAKMQPEMPATTTYGTENHRISVRALNINKIEQSKQYKLVQVKNKDIQVAFDKQKREYSFKAVKSQ